MSFILSRGQAISAQEKHARVTYLNGYADPLGDVEALSELCELVEAEVEIQVGHTFRDAMHEPSRSTRGTTVRFKAEGVDASTDVAAAFVVVGPVGYEAVNLAFVDVGGASGADDSDVEGDSAGLREVVHYDVAWAPVRASNHT